MQNALNKDNRMDVSRSSYPTVPCSAVLLFYSVCLALITFLLEVITGVSQLLSFNSNSKLQNKAFGLVLPLQKKCDNLGKPLRNEDVKTARCQTGAAERQVEAHSQN